MKSYVRTIVTTTITVATTVLGLGTVVAAASTPPRQTPPSQSTTYATAAATGLQASRLYIDPTIAANSGLNSADAQAVASELAAQSPPIYIVFEPEAAVPNVKNGYDAFPTMVGQLSSTLGVAKGTVGAIFPAKHYFRASSAVISSPKSDSLADDLAKQSAAAKGKTGMRAMIEDFIGRVHSAVVNRSTSSTHNGGGVASGSIPQSHSHTGLWIFLSIFGLIVVGTVGAFVYVRRQVKRDMADEVAADRSRIEADYDSLGSDLTNHADEFSTHSNGQVREEYLDASTAYSNAGGLLAGATTARKIQVVADIISSGQTAMERAKRAARGETAIPRGSNISSEDVTDESLGGSSMYDKRPIAQPIRRRKGHPAPAAGTTRIINNTTTYYYPGGNHGGRWYGPGYYDGMDPWMSYMVAEELFEDHDHDDRGDRDDRGDNDIGNYDQGGQQTGSYDQGSDSYDQGSSTPDPEPVSTPDWGSGDSGGSSYDFGGSDSGGGYDSGGSSDSGGGGGGDW